MMELAVKAREEETEGWWASEEALQHNVLDMVVHWKGRTALISCSLEMIDANSGRVESSF